MNPKPRSFQRQAVPVTRSPVPSPILPRVGDRLGPRRGERPRGGDRERPRGGLRPRAGLRPRPGGERERLAMPLSATRRFFGYIAAGGRRQAPRARTVARSGSKKTQRAALPFWPRVRCVCTAAFASALSERGRKSAEDFAHQNLCRDCRGLSRSHWPPQQLCAA